MRRTSTLARDLARRRLHASVRGATRRFAVCLAVFIGLAHAGAAKASDIGVTPVAVHLDQATDRATVSVVNSGAESVTMQVEAIEWSDDADAGPDRPTADMVINPSIFAVPAGQSQLVRVGLRRPAQPGHEGTYRIVLREVPRAPRPGEARLRGQVQVLMAVRVPIFVAPTHAVHEARWRAVQAHDGTITASVENEGNVHVRVGKIQLRSSEGNDLVAEEGLATVVLAGTSHKFRMRTPAGDPRRMTLDVVTDEGIRSVPVVTALR